MTRQQIAELEAEAFRAGFRAGVFVGEVKHTQATHIKSTGADGERHLRVVPADEPTARIFDFPATEKTAS